ncbi:hypothetical protein V499_03987 [Pseudogymnoascus sp. VKM F-103]|nr:hypothetical protein V499_03987 [Pseudogymnoascus sp. VKM F-103]
MSFPKTLSLLSCTAIVTGGTRGIGKGISMELARRGASVALVYGNPARASDAASTVAEIVALNKDIKAIAICADLRDRESPKRIVEETLRALGTEKIDILVHNAANPETTPTPNVTHEIFDTVMDVGLRAPFFLTQAAQPYMHPGSRIIFISSTSARSPSPGITLPLYAASKAAGESLVRSWAFEFGHSHGITVNAVSVAYVETEAVSVVPAAQLEAYRMASAKITAAAPRPGTPDDIAQIVAFLASDSARWVTGSTVANLTRILVIGVKGVTT